MAAPDFIFLDVPDGNFSSPTDSGSAGYGLTAVERPYRFRGSDVGNFFSYNVSGGNYTSGWCHFYMNLYYTITGRILFQLEGASAPLIRMQSNTTTTGSPYSFDFQYFDGSIWVKIGATVVISRANPRFDIHWNLADVGGLIELYVNGAVACSFSGDTLTTTNTTINTIMFNQIATSALPCQPGHVIVDSQDTRGLELEIVNSTAAGAYFAPQGTESDIDDSPTGALNTIDDTSINFTVAAERVTLLYPAIDFVYAGWAVEEVIVGGFVRSIAEEDAFYMKPALRKGTSDFNPAGNFRASSEFVHLTGIRIPFNPDGGGVWTQSAVNSYEFGLYASATP
jgi:hypothetical protein